MSRRFLVISVLGLLFVGGTALAQDGGNSSSNGNSSTAEGGSSTSGGSSSSVSIHTTGGASVGVAQGSVSGGSTASGSNGDGDQQGASTGGDSVGGQAAGVAPVASTDGLVQQIDLPALQFPSQSASGRVPAVAVWALAALLAVGMFLLYRRLPRASRAA
jgi:hypothetical protein